MEITQPAAVPTVLPPAKKRGRPAKAKTPKTERAPRENPFEKVFGALAPLVRNFTRAQRTELRHAIHADSSKLDAINTKIEKLQEKAKTIAGATEIVQSYRDRLQQIADIRDGKAV